MKPTAHEEIANPWDVLGVPLTADDQEIREAYLRLVKAYPPDQSPKAFEAIRDAYATLHDARQRFHYQVLAARPTPSFVNLLDECAQTRRFVGPNPWLDVIRGSK